MPLALRLLCLLAACLPATASPAADKSGTQYVILSFDGALPIEQWERSRALARQTGAEFTYFLSCVYLLTRENRQAYQPPGMAAGRSNVGFAESRDDIALRLRQIWAARLEGHEIASHGCGHFDGGDWSASQWSAEFDAFDRIVAHGWENNDVPYEPSGWRAFVRDEIVGFRAPYLSTGPGLFEALPRNDFAYDASTVSNGPVAPKGGTVTRFSLPMIPEGPRARPVIAMDYNLFVRHSAGVETVDAEGRFEERALEAFRAALEREMAHERHPLQIGFHFTLMNGGAYWRALERFAQDACGRPQVRCVSYRGWLEETEEAAG